MSLDKSYKALEESILEWGGVPGVLYHATASQPRRAHRNF